MKWPDASFFVILSFKLFFETFYYSVKIFILSHHTGPIQFNKTFFGGGGAGGGLPPQLYHFCPSLIFQMITYVHKLLK